MQDIKILKLKSSGSIFKWYWLDKLLKNPASWLQKFFHKNTYASTKLMKNEAPKMVENDRREFKKFDSCYITRLTSDINNVKSKQARKSH